MKTSLKRVLFIVLVIIFCIIFAEGSPLGDESIQEQAANMSVEDFCVTIVDEDTICIENLIKDDSAYYCWVIKNYADGLNLSSGTMGEPMKKNDVIEFTYEVLEKIQFQGVVSYDGYSYTSITFGVEEDGSVYVVDDTTTTVATSSELTRDISDIVSLAFLAFLSVTLLLYYIVPKKLQWIVLLGASVAFYLLSGIQYIIFIIVSSWIAYRAAKKMSARKREVDILIQAEEDKKVKKRYKADLQKKNKVVLLDSLIGTLGVMVVIKYADFIITNINAMLHTNIEMLTLLMPLGLSFYTFMIIAYLLDVYRGKYMAEESFGRFFLFISFFPQVSQGPLSRYDEVAPQLKRYHAFNYEEFCFGAQRILWGFFVKLVLADRIASIVDGVYDSYATQSYAMLIIASVAYSIQIYADFYSSMEIAIGTAQMFGVRLQENFMRPYFSTTMPEFWRRWHSTLGTWFKDYVFYPISISKKVMKFSVNVRKKFGPDVARVVAAAPPIMGVWILTGLWHGSSWKFVAWGMFHGTLILLSTAFAINVQNALTRLGIKTEMWYYKLFQMFKVFMLCTIGRVFFRATNITAAFSIFWRIITFSTEGLLIDFSQINLDIADYIVLPIALVILLMVSIVQEKLGGVREIISKWNIAGRWIVWILLIFVTLLFGVYGPGASPVFIYEAF